MSQFWLLVAAATLIVTAVLVLPLLRRRPPDVEAGEAERHRLAVFRDRRGEIERERASGRMDPDEADQAQEDLLRQLAIDLPPEPAGRAPRERRTMDGMPRITAVVLVGLVPTLTFLTYHRIGAPALVATPAAPMTARASLPPGHPPTRASRPQGGDLATLLAGIEQRTREAPQDGEAWAMLGMTLKLQSRHQAAVDAFERAIAIVQPDARLLAEAAESLAMVQGGVFAGRPMEMLERALALDPAEPGALWLMAAARFRSGDTTRAREHLERLRAGMPAGSPGATRVEQVLARIEENVPPGVATVPVRAASAPRPVASREPALADDTIVAGVVRVDPGLAEEARRGGTLFVIARQAGGPPIPIAVRREPGASLPMRFALGDDNAMTPARLLSTAGALTLEARLSRSGTANRQAGDLYGLLTPVEPGHTDLEIVMDKVVDAAEVKGDAR